jgi:hypothetical protein
MRDDVRLLRMKRGFPICIVLASLSYSGTCPLRAQSTLRLVEWERGVALQALSRSDIAMYLWFYEWNMFEAVSRGQHTPGKRNFPRTVNASGTEAVIGTGPISLRVRVVHDGADLLLRIRNESNHDWPDLAGIIPCWSPGRSESANPAPAGSIYHVPATPQFADPEFNRTLFLSANGLTQLMSRAIHFNSSLRGAVNSASDRGRFAFSAKWPTSDIDATGGFIVRESSDGAWVTGIGWEDYLSVQGP